MSWMHKAALICVRRHVGTLCPASGSFTLRLQAVDHVDFILPSDTADHLTFAAQITRCFYKGEAGASGANEVEIACHISVHKRSLGEEAKQMNLGDIYFQVIFVGDAFPVLPVMPVEDDPAQTSAYIKVQSAGPHAACDYAEAARTRMQRLAKTNVAVAGTPQCVLCCVA